MVSKQDITQRYIEVTAHDLPLSCPMPNMSVWNAHPKVIIPLKNGGEARCPYCGTLYKFKGDLPKSHH
ncbi:MAG: zinc-finger domain-containing protein [Gallionellales bacterium CG_4_9_14_0_8_um_filter_55_61]|nr:MAG: zinc-finger domain-containing protein [Gallionellales bacterium CG_4_9_14_0_8_um_filter_55_61]